MKLREVEKVSKALADETRLKIFQAISAADQITCGEIVSMRGVTPATVSHHLKILNEAGLITCQRKGQFVYSQAVPDTLLAYLQALGKIAAAKRKGANNLRRPRGPSSPWDHENEPHIPADATQLKCRSRD